MSGRVKTTVYLDRLDYRRLKEIAEEEGSNAAEQIREAVAAHVAAREKRRLPTSIGSGRSGRDDLSEKAESLLRGMGRK